jgi:hypothetical protein
MLEVIRTTSTPVYYMLILTFATQTAFPVGHTKIVVYICITEMRVS